MNNPLTTRASDHRPTGLDTLNDDVVLTIARMASSFRDVLSLRLTCKALSNNLIEWFRAELPMFHNRRPDRLILYLSSPSDVEKFSGLTQSELIAHQITHLRINVTEFNSKVLHEIEYDLKIHKRYGKLFLEDIGSNPSEDWDLSDPRPFRANWREAIYHKYQQAYIEQEWMKASSKYKKHFPEGFRKLPNLKKIVIGDWAVDKKHDTNDYSIVRGQYTSPHDTTFGCKARTAALSTLLANLALNPQDLETLIIQRKGPDSWRFNNEEAGTWAFDIPASVFSALTTSMGHLKKLHLTLSDGTFTQEDGRRSYSVAPDGTTTESGLRALTRFVSMSPVLESFSLAAAIDTLFPATFIRGILRILPPTLCRIHLFNIITSVTDLNKFFWERRAMLRCVGLTRVYLVGENWTPVFKLMKDHLPSLEILHLEQLWELFAEFSVWLYFPRVHGFGRRYDGRFVDGRWYPEQGYDSLDCRKPGVDEVDDFQPFTPYSIQKGLARAIWKVWRDNRWTTGELAEYGMLPKRVVDHIRETFGEILEPGFDDTDFSELFVEW
ncbi:uncharacterized protein LTHEOB_4998 [Lasiodiplodia theobromae]|uniref:uncharacterized protein n=1 Tax=Lasiodiplodia theobromae TaxID=45133 RepID=UPI0015C3CF23|nr:uncharacterized protein LTHEOB_4998 [Lasiodiplodia theobromae]KAF4545739.1 hypothetical protein LTHEOB_4998 [Lasiodiplodia theobromae]